MNAEDFWKEKRDEYIERGFTNPFTIHIQDHITFSKAIVEWLGWGWRGSKRNEDMGRVEDES